MEAQDPEQGGRVAGESERGGRVVVQPKQGGRATLWEPEQGGMCVWSALGRVRAGAASASERCVEPLRGRVQCPSHGLFRVRRGPSCVA